MDIPARSQTAPRSESADSNLPVGKPPRIVNEYKRFVTEPDLVIRLPSADDVQPGTQTQEIRIRQS